LVGRRGGFRVQSRAVPDEHQRSVVKVIVVHGRSIPRNPAKPSGNTPHLPPVRGAEWSNRF
jgi:hypothetical protein